VGVTFTYLPDLNKYLYFGGLSASVFITEQSEIDKKEQEEREKQEIESYSLYYRQEYLRMKKANNCDTIYLYDPSRNFSLQF
jgi:hypothetical protein